MIIDRHPEHTTFNGRLAALAVNEIRAALGRDEIDLKELTVYLMAREPVSKRTIRDLGARSWSRLPKALRG